MNIKVLKRKTKAIDEFDKREWEIADKEHYDESFDWQPRVFYLTAVENNEIIGSLFFLVIVGVAEIKTLIVDHTKRGKKIGTALIEKTEEVAKKNGVHKLYLVTGKGWKAENFYIKNGFTRVTELKNHYAKRDFVEFSKFI